MPKKVKSRRQVAFLLSKGSPLSEKQKNKLKAELKSGAVSVEKSGKKRQKKGKRNARGVRVIG